MTDIAILRLHNRIDFLEDRMTDMEAKLSRAAVSNSENDRPQRDTDWRPYTGKTNEDCPVHVDDYVEVLTRDNHHNYGRAIRFDWSDNMHGGTIIAWRYAKEGE